MKLNEIYNIFDYFFNNVLKNNKKISANEIVYIFIELVLNHKDIRIQKKNKLVLSDGVAVDINKDNYDTFIKLVLKHNFKEKDVTEIADRLIEDTERRRKGEFYTPVIWVNEGHKMISDKLGDDWKEEYIVWDCAWGTGNLTRDYKFKELYCSTLNEGDLEIGKRYNKNSIKFQYDFLNDDLELIKEKTLLKEQYKLPKGLLSVLKENKPIIFLINPPYATANNAGTKKGDHKEGVAQTKINLMMKKDDIGASSQQLYAQFIYRILKTKKIFNLTNVHLAMFSPTIYLTGSQFKTLRKIFLEEFNYQDAMLFNASHFDDCSKDWGISFSIWSSGECLNKNTFTHKVKDIDTEGNIVNVLDKQIYNLDDCKKTCSDWIKEEVKKIKTKDAPQLSSAINVKQKGRGRLVDGALGYYVNGGNNVYKNNTDVYLLSSAGSVGNGISIIKDNIEKVCVNFATRKLISGKYNTWINQKDEYLIPNINHEKYNEFKNDSIIFSLFNSASNQSSLRNVNYSNTIWNIKNEFFFLSVSDIKILADENENDEVYEDIKAFGDERFIYKKLNELNLSKESQDVLDKAIKLTKDSFKYRVIFNEENPEYQVNTWDAGWYQIRILLKKFMTDDYNEFLELYKKLEEKMRPLVYELGFLRK